jgi:hypothetical protein
VLLLLLLLLLIYHCLEILCDSCKSRSWQQPYCQQVSKASFFAASAAAAAAGVRSLC